MAEDGPAEWDAHTAAEYEQELADRTADDELVNRLARASWYATDGFITDTPWPPRNGYRAEKERRRARAMLAAYRGESWYVGQEIEWNPTGDEWKTGVIGRLADDAATIVLHENRQVLLVETRHLRTREAHQS